MSQITATKQPGGGRQPLPKREKLTLAQLERRLLEGCDMLWGDTINKPLHLDGQGEVKRFDRVIANPPFSQNYFRKEMKFPERLHTFLPESGNVFQLQRQFLGSIGEALLNPYLRYR